MNGKESLRERERERERERKGESAREKKMTATNDG